MRRSHSNTAPKLPPLPFDFYNIWRAYKEDIKQPILNTNKLNQKSHEQWCRFRDAVKTAFLNAGFVEVALIKNNEWVRGVLVKLFDRKATSKDADEIADALSKRFSHYDQIRFVLGRSTWEVYE